MRRLSFFLAARNVYGKERLEYMQNGRKVFFFSFHHPPFTLLLYCMYAAKRATIGACQNVETCLSGAVVKRIIWGLWLGTITFYGSSSSPPGRALIITAPPSTCRAFFGVYRSISSFALSLVGFCRGGCKTWMSAKKTTEKYVLPATRISGYRNLCKFCSNFFSASSKIIHESKMCFLPFRSRLNLPDYARIFYAQVWSVSFSAFDSCCSADWWWGCLVGMSWFRVFYLKFSPKLLRNQFYREFYGIFPVFYSFCILLSAF